MKSDVRRIEYYFIWKCSIHKIWPTQWGIRVSVSSAVWRISTPPNINALLLKIGRRNKVRCVNVSHGSACIIYYNILIIIITVLQYWFQWQRASFMTCVCAIYAMFLLSSCVPAANPTNEACIALKLAMSCLGTISLQRNSNILHISCIPINITTHAFEVLCILNMYVDCMPIEVNVDSREMAHFQPTRECLWKTPQIFIDNHMKCNIIQSPSRPSKVTSQAFAVIRYCILCHCSLENGCTFPD